MSAPFSLFAPVVRLLALGAIAPLVFTGCATLTKGSSQTVTVTTDPPGAICTIAREGQTVAVVNPTPGSIPVEKSSKELSVVCDKPGYQPSSGALASSFQAMTFGNILFGGLIGVAIDAGSGAANEYPTLITLTLVPDAFKTEADRDAFFARMKSTFEIEYKESLERIKQRCGSPAYCDDQIRSAEASRTMKLAEIEAKRLQAKIAPS
jgi:hypothetical protein